VWGVTDTADCLAGLRYLSGLDWVDADRIAIFGASYGSYLALAALVAEPEGFACGAAKYGDSDILTSWAQGDRGGSEDMERMMGHPADHRDAYRAGSPIHRLEAIRRPILVAHGEGDDRVHPAQSQELVAELKRLGKTYEYVTYPTEGHGLIRSAPQVHFYRRLERFLDWYLM
jgi:dipeptidyl aminopeptidase/acylaminoacyl peptidase